MTTGQEAWRSVVGYDGYYEVSDRGRVRSVERSTYSGPGGMRRVPETILRPHARGADGRRHVALSVDGDRATKLISALVLAAFVGPRPPGMLACHNDGNPSDDRLTNLRWDTYRENALDKVRHGTQPESNRTHCPRGHRLEAPNLVPSQLKLGGRNCLACNRAGANVRDARRRGQELNLGTVSDDHYARIMRAA